MKEWLEQYWYLLLVFAAVCIVALVILFFAARALSEHNKLYKQQEQEMLRLLALKEKYMDFTEKTLEENDEAELLEGVALSYQIRIQRQTNPEKAFEELCEEKKNIYVLDVFCADGDAAVFFSENGTIVRSRIISALRMVGMDDFADRLTPVYDMYDPDNEEISFNEKSVNSINEYINGNNILTLIKLSGAKYIKNNFELLKN